MQAKHMHTNQTLVVTGGPLKDVEVTVVDPTPIPDGEPNQRKVEVKVEGEEQPIFILPKFLDTPDRQFKPVAQPTQQAALQPVLHIVSDSESEYNGRRIEEATPITDAMDPALDRYRPDANVVKRYVARTMPNGMKDYEFLLALRNERNDDGYIDNLGLVGETQAGKTMLVQVLAVLSAEQDGMPKPYPIFTINGSQGVTNYDLFGAPSAVIVDGREVIVWMEGKVPLAARCGGILYLDEWNAVPQGQATALHPVLDDRRAFSNLKKAVPDGHGGWSPEEVKLHPDLWTITTINPAGYKGVQQMAEASTNRFTWITWDYDEAVEKRLVPSSTIRAMGLALREARNQRIVSVPIGTSALQRLQRTVALFGPKMAMSTLIAMFPPVERDRVEAIVTDRGYLDLLAAEYPTPKYGDDAVKDQAKDQASDPEPF
jgi:MoxR-like ATPase